MSAFFAIDLDEPVRGAVSALVGRHRDAAPDAKWLGAHKLHLTVAFVGHPRPDTFDAFMALAAPVVRAHAPFTLALRGAGTFATARAPSVLWLGVTGALGALAALQSALDRAVEPLVAPEQRRSGAYRPHVTLARGRDPAALEAVALALRDFESPTFTVRGVTFYESTHAQYRAVGHGPLAPLAE